MDVKLTDISREHAEHLLSEVDFENRIVGITRTGSAGNNEVTIYSLQELAEFIIAEDTEKLFQFGRSTLSYIDFDKVIAWVRDVYKDQELADLLVKEIDEKETYVAQILAIKDMVYRRLVQAKELLAG